MRPRGRQVTAGEAVRVWAGGLVAEPIRFNAARFTQVGSALTAAPALRRRLHGQPHDVLAGLAWGKQNLDNIFSYDATTLTDGDRNQSMYVRAFIVGTPSFVNYDLGSQKLVGNLGIDVGDGTAGRPRPTSLEIAFSNDNFATILTTRTVSLSDVQQQVVSFDPVTARYVSSSSPSVPTTITAAVTRLRPPFNN